MVLKENHISAFSRSSEGEESSSVKVAIWLRKESFMCMLFTHTNTYAQTHTHTHSFSALLWVLEDFLPWIVLPAPLAPLHSDFLLVQPMAGSSRRVKRLEQFFLWPFLAWLWLWWQLQGPLYLRPQLLSEQPLFQVLFSPLPEQVKGFTDLPCCNSLTADHTSGKSPFLC